MAEIHPVNKERHAGKSWSLSRNFSFAAEQSLVLVNKQEALDAFRSLPLAFIKFGESYRLVAVLGIKSQENLLVRADGSWLGRYIPERFRAYPFMLGQNESEEKVICIDEQSGQVQDSGADTKGHLFFDESGQPTDSLNQIVEFYQGLIAREIETDKTCQLLSEKALIKPWEILLRNSDPNESDSEEHRVEGLFCIDEQALNALPGNDLVEVRDAGGLWLSYCQLFSMRYLQSFGQLAQIKARQQQLEKMDIEEVFDGGNISFENL